MSRHGHTLGQRGFTIIELMIATTVVSVILLLVTLVMTGIGNLYYKGVKQSLVQDSVRSITDELAAHLQTATSIATAAPATEGGQTVNAFCINSNTRYTYVENVPISPGFGGPNFPHVMWRDTLNPDSPCVPADLTQNDPSSSTGGSNGGELVATASRLTALCIGNYDATTSTCARSLASPYVITVGEAFGDIATLATGSGTGTTCKGTTGDQYCATATLTTTVSQRVY